MVEVDEADFATAGARQGGCCVGADAAAADDDYKGVAQLGEAFVGEEDAVTGELLEDQGFVVVAQAGAAGEGDAAFVFFGLRRCALGGAAEVVDLGGLLG